MESWSQTSSPSKNSRQVKNLAKRKISPSEKSRQVKNLAKRKISPSEKSRQVKNLANWENKNLPMGKGLDIMKLKIPNISW